MKALLATLLLVLVSCAGPGAHRVSMDGTRFDHVVVFAPDGELQEWLERHFTHADALDTRHEGQGTSGRYFLFLNSFLEVLTLEDEDEARRNEAAFGSPYSPRWSDEDAAALAIGLTLDEAAFASPPFAHQRYRASDEGGGYVMADGNTELAAPLVYATGPARAYRSRDSIEEVEAIDDPGRREAVRRFLTHPSGVRKLTRVIWRAPATTLSGSNVELLGALPEVRLAPGPDHELVLEFDDGERGDEVRFDGRPAVVLRF